MRSSSLLLLPAALLVSIPGSIAIRAPDWQPFLSALPELLQDYLPISAPNSTSNTAVHDVLKRQYSNTCPTGFNSCANLGAPSLCCMSDAVCSADSAGSVACCPSGAACTGTIGGIITGGTVDPSGGLVGVGSTATGVSASTTNFQFASSTSSGDGLVAATTPSTVATDGGGDATTSGGFILNGGQTVATPGAAARAVQVVSISHPRHSR